MSFEPNSNENSDDVDGEYPEDTTWKDVAADVFSSETESPNFKRTLETVERIVDKLEKAGERAYTAKGKAMAANERLYFLNTLLRSAIMVLVAAGVGALTWYGKLAQEAAAPIIGGIVGAMFVPPQRSR